MGVLMVELVDVLVEERMGVDEPVGDVEEAVEDHLEEEEPVVGGWARVVCQSVRGAESRAWRCVCIT